MQNLFPPKGSLVNAPQKKKKGGGKEKQRKRGGEKAKGKRRKGSETFSKKNHLEILLSAHARTLKAVIWHQEQKLVQCSTCKQRFGQFGFFSARQRPKNGLTRFERHFLAKCPGVNGLSKVPNFLVKSTFEHKTTKSSHKMPNPVKKTEKDDFQYF